MNIADLFETSVGELVPIHPDIDLTPVEALGMKDPQITGMWGYLETTSDSETDGPTLLRVKNAQRLPVAIGNRRWRDKRYLQHLREVQYAFAPLAETSVYAPRSPELDRTAIGFAEAIAEAGMGFSATPTTHDLVTKIIRRLSDDRLVSCWFNGFAVRVGVGHAYSFCCCD